MAQLTPPACTQPDFAVGEKVPFESARSRFCRSIRQVVVDLSCYSCREVLVAAAWTQNLPCGRIRLYCWVGSPDDFVEGTNSLSPLLLLGEREDAVLEIHFVSARTGNHSCLRRERICRGAEHSSKSTVVSVAFKTWAIYLRSDTGLATMVDGQLSMSKLVLQRKQCS